MENKFTKHVAYTNAEDYKNSSLKNWSDFKCNLADWQRTVHAVHDTSLAEDLLLWGACLAS